MNEQEKVNAYKYNYIFCPKIDSFYLPSAKLKKFIETTCELLDPGFDKNLNNSDKLDQDQINVSGTDKNIDKNKIIIIATDDLDDNWDQIISNNKNNYFSSEIIDHLIYVRKFFEFIFNHRQKVELWTKGSLTGSFFELFMAVGSRSISNENAIFGFDQLTKGYFPAGGMCQIYNQKGLIKKSYFKNKHIFCLNDLHKKLTYDHVTYNSFKLAVDYINNYSANPKINANKDNNVLVLQKPLILSKIYTDNSTYNYTQFLKSISNKLKYPKKHYESANKPDFFDELWSVFWKKPDSSSLNIYLDKLIENDLNKKVFDKDINHDYFLHAVQCSYIYHGWKECKKVGCIANKQIISINSINDNSNNNDDKSLLTNKVILNNAQTKNLQVNSDSNSNTKKINLLCIDCTQSLPPFDLIIHWLAENFSLMFVNSCQSSLNKQLILIFKQLAQSLKKPILNSIVYDKINCLVLTRKQIRTGGFYQHYPVIKFDVSSFVSINFKKNYYKFFRLSSNDFDSEIGLSEIFISKSTKDKDNIALNNFFTKKIIAGLINHSVFSDILPLCVWLRIQFYLAISLEAKYSQSTMVAIIKKLNQQNWSINSNQHYIKSLISDFSQAMHELTTFDYSNSKSGWIKNLPDNFKLHRFDKLFSFKNDINQILSRSHLVKNGKDKDNVRITQPIIYPRYRIDQLLSEHFLLLCIYLTYQLYYEQCFDTLAASDIFIKKSLGVPSKIGSLVGHSKNFGLDYLLNYANNHFDDQNFHDALKSLYPS